jgi:hypothetical protein
MRELDLLNSPVPLFTFHQVDLSVHLCLMYQSEDHGAHHHGFQDLEVCTLSRLGIDSFSTPTDPFGRKPSVCKRLFSR